MALSDNLISKCSEHLTAYKDACKEQPAIKSFDSDLQERTNKVIDSLTVEDASGKLSQHTVHMEVTKHLYEVTQGVADFITASKVDVWKNEALRSLVNAYFDNTIETLKIFNNIMNGVENAEMGQLYIQMAVDEFHKESTEKNVGGAKKKYEKTLKHLQMFKDMGDPFDGQVLTTQFELIKKQQESLLEEVTEATNKLKEEIAELEKNILIANVVFGAAFAVVAVASIALIATGVGAVAGFTALAAPLIAAGWAGVYSSLESKRDALEKELKNLKKLEEIQSSVEIGITTNEKASDTVSTLVIGLEDRIVFILNLADNAIEMEENEKALGRVVKLLGDKVEKLTNEIKDVGNSVAKHSKLIADARLRVQQKLVRG